MDFQNLGSLVKELGFPACAAGFLAWFLYRLEDKAAVEREKSDQRYETLTLKAFTKLEENTTAILELASKLEILINKGK